MSEGEKGRERERKEEMGRGMRLLERRRWGKGEGEGGKMGWRRAEVAESAVGGGER